MWADLMATAPYMNNLTRDFVDHMISIVGNPMYIGLILLLFFFFLIISLRISMDIAIVSYIPIILLCSIWIEPLRLLFAILVGILIAMGMLRLIGKR